MSWSILTTCPTRLWEGNVFTRVCLSVWSLPMMHWASLCAPPPPPPIITHDALDLTALADLRRAWGMKFWQNRVLVALGELVPSPRGNPGAATSLTPPPNTSDMGTHLPLAALVPHWWHLVVITGDLYIDRPRLWLSTQILIATMTLCEVFKLDRERNNATLIPNLYSTNFIDVGISVGLGQCELTINAAWCCCVKITIRRAESQCWESCSFRNLMERDLCNDNDNSWLFLVWHIRKTDGFLGLYRGLGARLCSGVVSAVVTNNASSVCSSIIITLLERIISENMRIFPNLFSH